MSALPTTDEQLLLHRLRNGDDSAFRILYDRYKEQLTGKLLRLLKSDELIQDSLQDIFLKIWQARERINPELSFGGLLNQMARNHVIDIFRKAKRDVYLRQQLASTKTEIYSHVLESMISQEEQEKLHMAITQLPERQREVFVLHKLEGKSYKEISELLNIKPSAINQHIYRAMQSLSHTLQPKCWLILVSSGLFLI